MNLGNQHFSSEDNNNFNSGSKLNPIMSPITAAIIGLVSIFVLYQIGGSIITLLIFGMNFKNADINSIRLLTMGSQILFILLPSLLLAKAIYVDVTEVIRFRFPAWNEVGLFLIGLIILIPLLQNFLYLQNYFLDWISQVSPIMHNLKNTLDKLDKIVESTYGNLLKANNFAEGILIILVVSVTPAICEEIFFRGFVQKSFELRLKPIWAIFITAVFFGLYHFSPYGLIALIVLGTYLGFSAYKTNSIFVPMVLHFTNNFISIILFFIFGNDELLKTKVPVTPDIETHLIFFLSLTIVFVFFIMFIRKYFSNLKTKKGAEL